MGVLRVEQEIPVLHGCADIIVPRGNSCTNKRLFPMKSEEAHRAAPRWDPSLQGMLTWKSRACLVLLLIINPQDPESQARERSGVWQAGSFIPTGWTCQVFISR